MDKKDVHVIRNLASHSGDLAGRVMQKNTAAKLVEESPCQLCGGTGWRDIISSDGKRVARCDCFIGARAERLLQLASIPERYRSCDFLSYSVGNNAVLGAAKLTVQKWAEQYPLDQTGLLLIGPRGLGKTHLSIAALKELAKKGVHCLFCDYRELLKQIQNSYNPSVQSTELELLQPVFETEVVILDDLGAQKPSEWVWDTVSFMLNSRYNNRRTTIITSNFMDGPSAAEEGIDGPRRAARVETLGDRIGERMRSRLFEMCRLIQLDGRDYRQKFRTANFR